MRDTTFRVAIRAFAPFERAIAKQWDAFVAVTGCPLQLEAVPLDLPALHAALFG
jgi:multiple sugar transport system substrate-binding protein